MAIAVFRNQDGEASCRVWAERSWTLIASGEAGDAEIRIPQSAFARVAPYVEWDGGSTVILPSQGGSGAWIGIVTQCERFAGGVRVLAEQPWTIFGQRFVPVVNTIYRANVGFIWGVALDRALGSLAGYPMVGLSTSARTAPIIDYKMDGQDLMSVANDLMALSDGEPLAVTNHQNGCVYIEWAAPNSRMIVYPYLFVSDSRYFYDVSVDPVTLSQVSQVTTRTSQGRETRQWYTESAMRGWPAQAMLPIDEAGMVNASASAVNELNRTLAPPVSISGRVPAILASAGVEVSLWSILEGWYIPTLLRHHRERGATILARLMKRTLSDTDGMRWELLSVYDPDVTVVFQQFASLGGKKRSERSAGRSRQPGRRELADVRRHVFKLRMRR